MTDKLINGDYRIKTGEKALVQCDYTDELFQDAYVLLSARLGKFYPNKNFGSRINELKNEKPLAEYIEAYARQALSELDGVYVKATDVINGAAVFTLKANNTEGQVIIRFGNNL
ncbi:MAG: hypothetical protein E7571_01680 [Ruminococcaceae bacterium]|nr:hypothetical protein [Oscillospiraceae bacterium]